MEIEHVHNREIRYTLQNHDLKVGDKVYPIASGRCREDGKWVLHELNWEDYMTGFPDEPHTIKAFKKANGKRYREIVTDHGYSPEPCYYKIIKQEIQVKENKDMFPEYKWVEMSEPAPNYLHEKYEWNIDNNKWEKIDYELDLPR